jgi:hypothetical protein
MWNEKKGANELNKKLKPGFIQVVLNIATTTLTASEKKVTRMFPRLAYLRLDESLIMSHLDVFGQFRSLFTAFLEGKEGMAP